MEFSSIAELRVLDGLRLVLVAGSPSPWGQCAKAMMEFKGLDFATGLQVPAFRMASVEDADQLGRGGELG